jgi:threonine/homoserine/homoserine lactone efflux protein
MDANAVLDGFYLIMGLICSGFLVWGGWLCLRDRMEESERAQAREERSHAHWTHSTHAS